MSGARVAAGVVAVVICAALLWWLNLPDASSSEPRELDAATAAPATAVAATPATAMKTPPPATPPVPAPRPTDPIYPPELDAPLRAVTPEVERCLGDQRAHFKGPLEVAVHFTPLADGGFAAGTTVKSSWQDPYLSACIEDVFDELSYRPSGRERFAPADFTFHFGAVP